ncbi:hypothetical protein [Polyangium jinanense]|uniref:Lipoprotein n=1 Tax=Polyangium jinanense TaxID=2829994 RepID=A0A9X3X8M1_9BACT|nr:hypothetical protein [Polyangium jinanense]MDC3958279.1 hypothetical protein [Polyangium jinanense]MDC3983386.1 hypothetical protein [Polyangium jinanense]
MNTRGAPKRSFAGGAPLVFFVLACLATGCARNVTENDCKAVGEHLRVLWTAEAKYPEAASPSAEKAVAVVKSEGQRLEESFVTDCKRDLVGKPRASGEFSCLSHAKTLADVRTCATIPAH